MSRSYKKNPIVKDDGKNKKIAKTLATRLTRRKFNKLDYEMANGNAYKKEFESWVIADLTVRWTKERAIKDYETRSKYSWFKEQWPTLQDYLNFWAKCMNRK